MGLQDRELIMPEFGTVLGALERGQRQLVKFVHRDFNDLNKMYSADNPTGARS